MHMWPRHWCCGSICEHLFIFVCSVCILSVLQINSVYMFEHHEAPLQGELGSHARRRCVMELDISNKANALQVSFSFPGFSWCESVKILQMTVLFILDSDCQSSTYRSRAVKFLRLAHNHQVNMIFLSLYKYMTSLTSMSCRQVNITRAHISSMSAHLHSPQAWETYIQGLSVFVLNQHDCEVSLRSLVQIVFTRVILD